MSNPPRSPPDWPMRMQFKLRAVLRRKGRADEKFLDPAAPKNETATSAANGTGQHSSRYRHSATRNDSASIGDS